ATVAELRDGPDDAATLELLTDPAVANAGFEELRIALVEEGGEYRGSVGVLRAGSETVDESQLEESEQRFRSLVDAVEEYAIFMLDPDGRVATWNEGAERIKGYAEDEIVGQHFSTFYTDEDREAGVPASNLDAAMEESWVEDEGWRVRADGSHFWANVTITAVRDDDGTLQGFAKVTHDMTDRRERERELRRERDLNEKLLQTAPVAIAVYDSDGELLLSNRRTRDVFGLPESGDVDDLHDADRWDVYDAEEKPLPADELPPARVLESGEPVVNDEIAIDPPDGDRRWFRVNAVPLFDAEESVDRVVVAGEDVTELKRRERQLRRQRDELESELGEVFGRVSDAFFALDEEFRFTHINERAHELINPEDRELVGESIWDQFPKATERLFKPHYERALENQETVSFEEYYPEPLDIWFEVRAYPSETGLSVYFRDISERKQRERELEESERRYRTLAEHFPNGVVTLFDHDLEYTLAAGQGFDRIPVDPEDLEGNSFRDAWDEETVDTLEPAFQDALDGEESTVELEYVDREWIFQAVPIADERGDVFAGMTMAIDVTEQKEQERALEQYSEYLDDVIDGIDDLFYVLDSDGGLRRWNESLADVTGYSNAEIDSMDALDFFEEDAETIASAVAKGFEEGGVIVEADLVTNDGERIPYEFSATTVENPEGDTVLAGIGRDVSEQKDRERELTKYETIVETIEDGIYVKDEDGYFTMVNDAYAEMTGYDRDELVGAHASLVVDEATIGDSREMLSGAALEDGDEPTMEATLRTKDGGAIPAEGTFASIDTDDEREEVGVVRDITERKERRRKLEESNERLEQFAYAASHDLQEPLRMVSSYLSLVERRYADELDDDAEEFIEFAVDGAERMREMIDALLEYSRVETRGDPFEPVDLEAVYEDAIQDLEVKIAESDAEIEAEPLPEAYGDEGQLRQVFENLLSNAIEYSEEGPPQVDVGAERDGEMWIVSVSDDGIGIDPEHADRVFEVFNRLHTREEHDGTGIGLALCRRIVERHGGEIWVDSTPGEGSTFYFSVPAQGEDND
ncbi:PAS domain S-box protein, partial [Natronoarchaeum mannanilyticum]